MANPLVSLITVCFNSAKTIEETILSIVEQSYQPIQYIVIDGGSKDGTLAILEKYRDKIDIVISEPDKGIYDAMNKGILLAKGEIIGLLNADDIYADREVIATISDAFADSAIGAVFGDLIYFENHAPEKVKRYWRSSPFTPGLFAKGWSPAHPTFFVRRDVYARCGVFDLSMPMGNDVELMMRFLEKFKIQTQYLPKLLVKMRLGGVSNAGIKNILVQNQAILQAAKRLNIKMSPWQFWTGKIVSRFNQFFIEPHLRKKLSYDK